MSNTKIIPHLKSCCLALGLTKKDNAQPFVIAGSGFFIDPEGYFVTADHVVIGMENIREHYEKGGLNLEYRGFWFENINDEQGKLVAIKIENGLGVHIDIPDLKEFFPDKQDLAIGRLSGKHKFPFLNFTDATKIQVFDEIYMCGYPGGSSSLRTQDQDYGNRFSPVLQYGRIASLLPTDQSKNPFGIQTDIIGTGGSSGSPIVDAETERVIGIAQQVIPSSVNVSVRGASAEAKIGLVWGISNFFTADAITKMLKIFKLEFDENGIPLPTEKLAKVVRITDTFSPKRF